MPDPAFRPRHPKEIRPELLELDPPTAQLLATADMFEPASAAVRGASGEYRSLCFVALTCMDYNANRRLEKPQVVKDLVNRWHTHSLLRRSAGSPRLPPRADGIPAPAHAVS